MHTCASGCLLYDFVLHVQSAGVRYVVSVLSELPRAESGSADSFIAIVDGSASPDLTAQWTEHKRDCAMICLDILIDLVSQTEGVPAPPFTPPPGFLDTITCLAFVHLHVQSDVRMKVCDNCCCITTGRLRFHPMAQCVVHAHKGVSLRLARLPRTASSAQRSCRLRSTCAAVPGLFAYAEVTKNVIYL